MVRSRVPKLSCPGPPPYTSKGHDLLCHLSPNKSASCFVFSSSSEHTFPGCRSQRSASLSARGMWAHLAESPEACGLLSDKSHLWPNLGTKVGQLQGPLPHGRKGPHTHVRTCLKLDQVTKVCHHKAPEAPASSRPQPQCSWPWKGCKGEQGSALS